MDVRGVFIVGLYILIPVQGQVLDYALDDVILIGSNVYECVWRMNISNNYSYVIAFPSSIITYAIDYDPVDRVIYWVSWYRQISSGSVFGNSERTVRSLDVLAQTYGIAVDSISRLLFYTDLGNHIIAVISLVGSLHKTVISTGLTNPRDIVIDPINGSIYWADSGRPGRIEKSDYDGTNRRELVNTGLSSPYGLAVDINDGVLYWCEISTFKIQRVNVDGSNRSLIYDELVSLSYCSIALYHSYLYFTTWWSRYSIIRIGTDGRGLTYISSFVKYPHAIHVHINGRLGINGCSNGSGGCSHLCFPLPGGYNECACPDHMTLQADGKTCRQDDLPDEFILESDGTSTMRRIYINANYSSFILPFPNWIYAYDLDYDRTNGVIYWVNGSNQINSGSIFGMNIQTVGYLNSIAQINGIAVDSISRLLFYTDLGNHIIAAVSLDDYSQKTVISSGLLSPHAIVIDQINGAIYWVDSGNPAKIEKSNYDGTNRQEIVNTGLTNPYGLQVDINAGILYWCDVSTFTIERANEDGSNRSIIYQEQVSESGCSIALYHSYIYFTAWYNRTGIMRIGTDGSGLIYVGPYALHSPRGIHVNHDAHLGSNGCTNGRGGCSHFCFPQPSGSNVCACPDFMTLQPDGKNCHFDALPENFILVIDGSKRSIYRMDIDNYSYINIPIHNISYPNTIYYDPNDAVIFWTDSSFQQINYGSIYGNNQNTLQGFNTYAAINGTSVDVVSRLLFYTDSKQNIIGVISLDVNVTKTVISHDLNTPQAIVTDPTNGIIYWSSLNKIEKSNYDGTSRQEVIITGLDDNVDLAMDFNVYLMYWCHYSTRKIVQANMDGSNRQVLYQDQTTIYKCNIALHQSYLYYIDSSQSVLMRIATNGSGMTSIGPSIFHYVVDIHVHSNAPKNQGKNGCFNGRGGCSHFCFPQPGGSKVCDCPDDMTLQPDGLSCGKHILPERFLLILNQYYRDIYLVDIRTYRYVTIALENSYNPNAITYDPIDRNIYWTDQRFSQILSLSIDGDMKHTIRQLNRSTYPQAIAVDALSRLLFYADTEHIGVLSLDGSIHKIVISYNNTHLSVIAIDPINGTIYWTSWWINGKIEKSNYDGTNRQEIINSGLATPTGLTLDIRAGVLYWCDFSTAMLERANVDGTNRTVIYHKPGYVSLVKIALHQSHLYILGLRRRFTLMRIRTDGSNLTLFGPTQFGHNSDVVVHSNESGSLGPNGCSSRNGGCSHFCFPRPGGLKMCDCPDGLTLRTDGHTCRLHDDMCDEQPCENGAPCTNIGGLYICNCSRGWQGQKCSSDVDECSDNPCKNSGGCVNTYGSYVCNCSIGWQGQDCSDGLQQAETSTESNSTLQISIPVGGTLGAVGLMIIILFAILYWKRRKRASQTSEIDQTYQELDTTRIEHGTPSDYSNLEVIPKEITYDNTHFVNNLIHKCEFRDQYQHYNSLDDKTGELRLLSFFKAIPSFAPPKTEVTRAGGAEDYIKTFSTTYYFESKGKNELTILSDFPTTSEGIWRLALEHGMHLIIIIGENCISFKPKVQSYIGLIQIECIDISVQRNYMLCNINLSDCKKDAKMINVQVLVCDEECCAPSHINETVAVLKKRFFMRQGMELFNTLINCMPDASNGEGFVASLLMTDAMERSGYIDINGIIEAMRKEKHDAVNSFDKFKFCHDVIFKWIVDEENKERM